MDDSIVLHSRDGQFGSAAWTQHNTDHDDVAVVVPSNGLRREQAALPPTDTGYQAWLCLAGCFMANVLIWGFALSFGTLQQYYTTHEPFASHASGIPTVGTTTTGLSYLTMPVYFFLYQRRPQWRRFSTFASLPMIAAALIGASFADTIPQLIFCQGVLYALAGNALIVPTITYLDEWFVERKGLAVGIMWAGDGAGGVFMPLLLNALLEKFGFRWALRAISALIILLTAPMLFFLKPRVPVSTRQVARPINLTFIRSPVFWTLQTFNILEGLGYYLPSNYLPSYVESLGFDATLGSLSLLVLNLASVFGCISVGALVDRFDVTSILLGVSMLAATAVLLIWGLSVSIAPLYVFCVAYGLTAGGYSTSWGGIVKDVQRKFEGADTSMLFGLLAAGRGIGAVISGPLSESLLTASSEMQSTADFAYGSKYGPIIVFSGCSALVGGCSWVFRRAGLI